MTATSLLPPDAPSTRRGMARAWHWFEWLLILVLALDLAGSPLHPHRHDGQWSPAGAAEVSAHPASDEFETHLEDHDSRDFSHSITAIRHLTTEAVGGTSVEVGVAMWRGLIADGLVASGILAGGAPPNPLTAIHRSLPPEGRAPPLRG